MKENRQYWAHWAPRTDTRAKSSIKTNLELSPRIGSTNRKPWRLGYGIDR